MPLALPDGRWCRGFALRAAKPEAGIFQGGGQTSRGPLQLDAGNSRELLRTSDLGDGVCEHDEELSLEGRRPCGVGIKTMTDFGKTFCFWWLKAHWTQEQIALMFKGTGLPCQRKCVNARGGFGVLDRRRFTSTKSRCQELGNDTNN